MTARSSASGAPNGNEQELGAEHLGLTSHGLAVDPSDDQLRLAYADRPIGAFSGRADRPH
jgi:hypothetical protein